MTETEAQKTLDKLKKSRRSWCFDSTGKLWTLQTLSLYISCPSAYYSRI
ncbi:MAG: hypothetical protein WC455_13240 [Dehalococcoidia bacterium]|jgi:hypothetical protein